MEITLPSKLEQQLVTIARHMQRDPEDLAREGIAMFLTEQQHALEERVQIAAGTAALATGRVRPWDEIAAEMVADNQLPADWREQSLDDLLGPEEA